MLICPRRPVGRATRGAEDGAGIGTVLGAAELGDGVLAEQAKTKTALQLFSAELRTAASED